MLDVVHIDLRLTGPANTLFMAPIFITIMEQSDSESEFRNTALLQMLGMRITVFLYNTIM